ncbi:hypothetical protein LTR08_005161 [Meristemomyces frigidus]|nr:hypothetical protein LTR08_005161 [Meristemomyces frigidus]
MEEVPPPSGSELDYVRVIVDEHSQVVFDVPRRHLSEVLKTQQPETVIVRDQDHDAEISITSIFLRKANWATFADFVAWTKTGGIIQYPHNNTEWIIEHHARRLKDALALGINLKSTEYQRAALSELHALGPLLDWPEDFVSDIFVATGDDHPARRLIVAMVAAKTCGNGKRRVRQGPRDRNVERGDRICSGTFWKMFDAYCLEHGPECRYPEEAW